MSRPVRSGEVGGLTTLVTGLRHCPLAGLGHSDRVSAWVGLAVIALTLVAAVFNLVTVGKHRAPSLDKSTARRLERSLNRGRLPADEADRPAAVALARSRAASHWTVLMFTGLAASFVVLAQTGGRLDSRLFYGGAVLLLFTALVLLHRMVTARLALR